MTNIQNAGVLPTSVHDRSPEKLKLSNFFTVQEHQSLVSWCSINSEQTAHVESTGTRAPGVEISRASGLTYVHA